MNALLLVGPYANRNSNAATEHCNVVVDRAIGDIHVGAVLIVNADDDDQSSIGDLRLFMSF